jgi:glycosyltransferase involved in cell wall biosynthesis
MNKISVIIPAYNSEKTILATITSVQNQTFTDWEIIIINDGSTDNTLEVVEKIQDERIKIYSYENGGLSTARNRGITQAKGEFISFLDADDLWSPDKLELQLKALQENPTAGVAYSLVVSGLEKADNLFTFIEGNKTIYHGDVYRQLLLKNFISCGSNILVRRAAIESVGIFDLQLKSCEDWDCKTTNYSS